MSKLFYLRKASASYPIPKIGFKCLNNFNNLNGVKVFKVLNDLNRNNKKMPSNFRWTAFFIDYKDFTPRKRYLP